MTDRPYDIARAFIAAVDGADVAQQSMGELRVVADALARDTSLREFFSNRLIASSQKEKTLRDACGIGLGETAQQLLRVLIAHGALGDLRVILAAAQQEIDRQRNVARIAVTSAVELSPAIRSRIARALEKKLSRNVQAEFTVHPACIGGFRIEIAGSRAWDGTVRGRLDRIRARLAMV